MNDCQLQYASAFFADTDDTLLADAAVELAEPAGAVTRAVAEAGQEAWPEAADLVFGGGMEEEEEDEEDTSPGDIEEDPDDLPLDQLAELRALTRSEE